MRTNLKENKSVQFSVLSEDQADDIYFNALEVMQVTGVDIYHERARQILEDAGCHVEGVRVWIPPHLVREAIARTPENTIISHWDGSGALRIRKNEAYFGTGPSEPNFIDPYTEERRPFKREDAAHVGKVCDALSNIEFVQGLGSISDVTTNLADVYEFYELITHTAKPIATWSFSRETCKDIHEMAVVMAGGEEEFRKRPNYIFYAEPSPPLTSPYEAMDKNLFLAERGVPIIYTPCCMGGGTETASFAGLLTNALVESLHGLVIAQLVNPGTPYFIGGVMTVMDMKKTTYVYGGPELSLMGAAITDLGKHLGLPVFSTGGCTDAKITEPQAALESAFSSNIAQLSGANLIHDVGYSESGLTGNLFNVVMTDEIISMSRRVSKGVEVNHEALAVDIIDRVGPKGNFLTENHTRRNFKREFWQPELIERRDYEGWASSGKKPLREKVKDKTRWLIENHQGPKVPEEKLKKLNEILEKAEEREKMAVKKREA